MILNNKEDTKKFVKEFVKNIDNNDIILLTGDLGVGKTFLAAEIIKNLLNEPDLNVPSPSFSIVQLYQNKNWTIHHFDLYRIENKNELTEIGIYDALSKGLCIIEWPNLLLPIPHPHIILELKLLENDQRELNIQNIKI